MKEIKINKLYKLKEKTSVKLPLIMLNAKATPSVVFSNFDDYIDGEIDLKQILIIDKNNYYMMRVSGDSMIDKGIVEGDLLIIHTSTYSDYRKLNNKLVVAIINGTNMIKEFKIIEDKYFLYSANEKYKPLEITKDMDVVLGEVTGLIRDYFHKRY